MRDELRETRRPELGASLRGVFRQSGFGASVTRGERSPLVVTAYGHHQGINAGSSQTVDTDVDTGLNRLRDLPNVRVVTRF